MNDHYVCFAGYTPQAVPHGLLAMRPAFDNGGHFVQAETIYDLPARKQILSAAHQDNAVYEF